MLSTDQNIYVMPLKGLENLIGHCPTKNKKNSNGIGLN